MPQSPAGAVFKLAAAEADSDNSGFAALSVKKACRGQFRPLAAVREDRYTDIESRSEDRLFD